MSWRLAPDEPWVPSLPVGLAKVARRLQAVERELDAIDRAWGANERERVDLVSRWDSLIVEERRLRGKQRLLLGEMEVDDL